MTIRQLPTLAVVVVSLLLTACGGTQPAKSAMDPNVQTQLRRDIHLLAAAAAAHDTGGAQAALAALDADTAAAHTAGKLSDAQLAQIRAAAAAVQADLTPAPQVTVSVTPTPAATPKSSNTKDNGKGGGGDGGGGGGGGGGGD